MENPKKIGRYEILEELGHGAMGTVYRAKDPSMDRVVALKTIISVALASEQGTEFRERFYREARAAGALAHPGIVPVFDVGEHEGSPFLVMEFIDGKTLADTVKKGERLTLDRICEIGQKVAEALGYAHQRGVVHRDIKPANILLTSKESHGVSRPKITDFGVAKLAAGHTTMTGQMVGTPAFMPPEQFTGAPIDGRADIFSLGVVLYLMSTGEQPFPGESMTAVSYKVVNTDPVPPRKLNPSLPAKLESIILKCLAKSPDERYQKGDELARELGELRTGSTAAVLQNTAAQKPTAEIDSDQTFIETPAAMQSGRAPAVQPPAPAPSIKTKSSLVLVLVGIAAVVIIGAGSWYALRHRAQPAVQETTPPPAPSASAEAQPPAAPQSPATSETQPPVAPASPAAEKAPIAKAISPKSKTKAASTAVVSKTPADAKPVEDAPKKPDATPAPPPLPPPPPVVPTVDFNPKTLDPKANAKLKIECDQTPAALDFKLEMDGKLYLKRSAEGNKTAFDDFYVPPGVHEFRVNASSGAVQKTSNTVSSEFKAKKRHTLKIELRTQGAAPGSGVPQGLYPDTQLVLTLK